MQDHFVCILRYIILEYTQNDLEKHMNDASRLEEPKQELISIIHMQRVYI